MFNWKLYHKWLILICEWCEFSWNSIKSSVLWCLNTYKTQTIKIINNKKIQSVQSEVKAHVDMHTDICKLLCRCVYVSMYWMQKKDHVRDSGLPASASSSLKNLPAVRLKTPNSLPGCFDWTQFFSQESKFLRIKVEILDFLRCWNFNRKFWNLQLFDSHGCPTDPQVHF